MAHSRDNFSLKTIRALELRAATICSNPTCQAHTTAANTESNGGVLRVGVAAHIKAAAVGGARFDSNMTPEQRVDIANGIWLCQTCARMIVVDEAGFSVELLVGWKVQAESRIRDMVVNGRQPMQGGLVQPPPLMDVELVWTHGGRFNRGYSDKNPITEIDGQQVMLVNVGTPAIINWKLDWNYVLRLYNNSRREMFNISVELSEPGFDKITTLPKINNLAPLSDFTLNARIEVSFEGISKDADVELKLDYPANLEGMILTARYRDDNQQKYIQTFRLHQGDFVPVEG